MFYLENLHKKSPNKRLLNWTYFATFVTKQDMAKIHCNAGSIKQLADQITEECRKKGISPAEFKADLPEKGSIDTSNHSYPVTRGLSEGDIRQLLMFLCGM